MARLRFGEPIPLTRLISLAEIAPAHIEALLDQAFGADRHGRTAYLLRDGVDAVCALSFAALDSDGDLLGTLQCWPVALQVPDGALMPLILVGPVAVAPALQGGGIGRLMMDHMLAIADAGAADALMMIGDPDYYDRFFGFSADATSGWELPGPVERHRLLARIRRSGGVPAVGRIIPDPAFATRPRAP